MPAIATRMRLQVVSQERNVTCRDTCLVAAESDPRIVGHHEE